jgi:cyclopropane fatty-acyl-phospholipid synthase-like methyltransferase
VTDFFKFLKSGNRESGRATAEAERVSRRCTGLADLAKSLSLLDGQKVLDMGPTSPANISFFTSMGQRTYGEDVLLASRNPEYLMTGDGSSTSINVEKFLAENLTLEKESFDAVLLWDMPDYLHEELVKPVVQRIHSIMKPGALMLAFFHTKDAGPDAAYQRYHISSPDTIGLQRIPLPSPGVTGNGRHSHFRLQRIFNNRHIENLFHDFSSLKFFLGRDNIREVLIVR